MDKRIPDTCWSCNQVVSTMSHIFWHCPSLRPFWEDVTTTIKHLISVNLSGNPATCLLHKTERPIRKYNQALTMHLVNAAKGWIPSLWRQTQPPTRVLWYFKINNILSMEELTTTLNNSKEKLRERWRSWGYFILEHHSGWRHPPNYTSVKRNITTGRLNTNTFRSRPHRFFQGVIVFAVKCLIDNYSAQTTHTDLKGQS